MGKQFFVFFLGIILFLSACSGSRRNTLENSDVQTNFASSTSLAEETISESEGIEDEISRYDDDAVQEVIQLKNQIHRELAFCVPKEPMASEYTMLPDEEKQAICYYEFGGNDPIRVQLTKFIHMAFPHSDLVDYEMLSFSSPLEAPNEAYVLAGFQNSPSIMERYGNEDPVITELFEKLRSFQIHEAVFAEHVEQAARLFYGNDIAIEHRAYGYKSFAYCPPIGIYEIVLGWANVSLPILHYEDVGDKYLVEVAIYTTGGDGGLSCKIKDGDTVYFNYNTEFVFTIENEAPRALITLKKEADSQFGLKVESYVYQGHESNANR